MLQVGYQRDDAGKARFVGSESVFISTRSVRSQTQSQIRMRNRVSLFLSSFSGNELVHPGCRGLKAKNSPSTRSQMPLETACADAASMLHWVCEAPASISIVITTQSIPTELLTPAQFLAFQARGGTGIRSCLKSSLLWVRLPPGLPEFLAL
jgi:hypothetical protein